MSHDEWLDHTAPPVKNLIRLPSTDAILASSLSQVQAGKKNEPQKKNSTQFVYIRRRWQDVAYSDSMAQTFSLWLNMTYNINWQGAMGALACLSVLCSLWLCPLVSSEQVAFVEVFLEDHQDVFQGEVVQGSMENDPMENHSKKKHDLKGDLILVSYQCLQIDTWHCELFSLLWMSVFCNGCTIGHALCTIFAF